MYCENSNSLYLGKKSDILKRFSTHNYIDSQVKNYSAVVFDLLLFKVTQSMKNILHSFSEYLTKGLMYCAQITRGVMLLQIFISKIA